jgi:hypothetical protein
LGENGGDTQRDARKASLTSGDAIFGPDALAQRIQAAFYGSVGSLPRSLRAWAAVICHAANLRRLTEAMIHWIRGGDLEREEFARLFLGRDADDPLAGLLHDAAPRVERAMDHGELGDAAAKIAAAIQVVGPDRWSCFLAELEERALDPAIVAAIEHRRDDPIPPRHPSDARPDDAATHTERTHDPRPDRPEDTEMATHGGGGEHPSPWGRSSPSVPPVRNPAALKPGPGSRMSAPGSSLWDQQGGEWRYQPGDSFHYPHWDYNEHTAPDAPWRRIPVNGPSPWKP